jgi:hypothetical protein
MSATEIIEQIKTLPREERKSVYQFLSRDLGDAFLYDDFSLLGEDAEASDVEFAWPAQVEVITDERA